MMALTTSPNPKPVYHAPNSVGNNRQRRSSGRKSFTSSALPPTMDSPRTLCPRDCDAFSYKPNHLPRWYIPQELWERLPHLLQSALTTMQHAGAAVLTGKFPALFTSHTLSCTLFPCVPNATTITYIANLQPNRLRASRTAWWRN